MIGDYSIMDWVTLGGVLTSTGVILSLFIKVYRDSKSLESRFTDLSKEHTDLSKEHAGLSKEHTGLSREHIDLSKEHRTLSSEHEAIKKDTTYICDELKLEKMARQNLYRNTSRAKEILDTMDIMKEVVNQNLSLSNEVMALKADNQALRSANDDEQKQLIQAIRSLESRLVDFERYSETEDIRTTLKQLSSQLSEQVNSLKK